MVVDDVSESLSARESENEPKSHHHHGNDDAVAESAGRDDDVIRQSSLSQACCHSLLLSLAVGIGDGGAGGHVPPKIREIYFSGNYYEKFSHFSGKNHVKFGNCVNFSGRYKK